MNIAFFGSSENSLIILKALKSAGFKLKLVVTAPPRPIGRKQILTKTPPHTYAENGKLPILFPEKLDDNFLKDMKKSLLDVAVVADYARLIPNQVLEYPAHGCLNLHPSLLPKYRGSTPGEMAILHGEKETGMTIIKMDEKFDHGPIISQFKEEIKATDTSETLYSRLFSKGAEVLVTLLPAWVEGRIAPRQQDHSQATLAPRLSRDDGFIPWELLKKALRNENVPIENRPNKWKMADGKWPIVVERATRALFPWPGVWTIVKVKNEEKRMKILSAHLEADRLILNKVQIEGKTSDLWNNVSNLLLNPRQ